VHEFVTGGGWPGEEPPPSLAAEAAAMLRAVLDDLRAWGRFRVVTTRDRRSSTALPAERIVEIDHDDYERSLLEAVRGCEAALLIAPESGGALARVSALLAGAGLTLLGGTPEAIAAAGDKWECHRRFVRAGLMTPETVRVAPHQVAEAAAAIGLPVVVKPLDGAGCDGVGLVRSPHDVAAALALPAVAGAEAVLVQRFVAGDAASVSLLVADDASCALSLNEQRIRLGIPCAYTGGAAAVEHPLRAEALALARAAVALFPGLQGYAGVDLVLGREACWLIEVNPRLTTSYIGLRQAVDFNLAEAVWLACTRRGLPRAMATGPAREVDAGEAVETHA
jgi:hypothetical protein